MICKAALPEWLTGREASETGEGVTGVGARRHRWPDTASRRRKEVPPYAGEKLRLAAGRKSARPPRPLPGIHGTEQRASASRAFVRTAHVVLDVIAGQQPLSPND